MSCPALGGQVKAAVSSCLMVTVAGKTQIRIFTLILIDTSNLAQNDRLKPLIRLLKWWNLANGNHLRSFHLEILIQRMWDSKAIGTSWPQVVRATLGAMPGWVESRCKDPWDASAYIDDYLSVDERSRVARMLRQDAIASTKAEQYRQEGKHAAAFERWDSVFRGTFPQDR
jgi:hypothetical protein